MSSFCFQCALDMRFEPPGDFAGMCKEGYVVGVLCEGCGYTVVDHRGVCTGECVEASHGTSRDHERVSRAIEAWERSRRWPWRWWHWWAGTPWGPGYYHHLRWCWYDWRERKTELTDPDESFLIDYSETDDKEAGFGDIK